jgi:ABC-type uncharacterized transport system permease subunit
VQWINGFLESGVRVTTPILLATMAGVPTLWTADINIGLEGIMIFGAFLGVAAGIAFHSLVLAITVTLLLAIVSGLLFALAVTKLRVNVFIAGLVLIVVAGAATVYMLQELFGVQGSLNVPGTPGLPTLIIPGVSSIPILGALLSGQGVMSWVTVIVVVFVFFMDKRSVLVRHLRAAGSHPVALATSGVSVDSMRIIAQIWCFALAALAGVQISLGQLSLFTNGMTAGMGFIALAAVIFSRGRVWLAVLMALVFGFATSLTYQIDKNVLPTELTQLIPYVVAFVGLVVLARTSMRHRRAPLELE